MWVKPKAGEPTDAE
jgi:hypothetical protein